jgi:hypothetical protein
MAGRGPPMIHRRKLLQVVPVGFVLLTVGPVCAETKPIIQKSNPEKPFATHFVALRDRETFENYDPETGQDSAQRGECYGSQNQNDDEAAQIAGPKAHQRTKAAGIDQGHNRSRI